MIRANIEAKIGQPLTDEEFDFFQKLLRPRSLRKKEFLVREGEVCAHNYFVERGVLVSFFTDAAGDAHVIQFALEGYWIADLYSFFSGKPALYTIEALEDCQLLAFDRAAFQAACDQLPKFERYFRILIQNAYVNAQHRIACTFSADAEQRYRELVTHRPDVVQRIPQFLIASYLGVKPQSLSRIRKQISEKR